jgi:methyl halide transferase
MSENSNMESRSDVAGYDVDWEDRYRRGHTPWERGGAHPALLEWLETSTVSGRVIVPGCGFGHDVRALARAGAEVVGLDIAPLAISAAESFPRQGRESYFSEDFFDPKVIPSEFDWLFEHTFFCAIPPERRADYARRVAELLRPGGRLLAIFFLDPDNDGDGPPYGCAVEELNALFSARFRLLSDRSDIATYPGKEGRELLRLLVRI